MSARRSLMLLVLTLAYPSAAAAQKIDVDLSRYTPRCGVEIQPREGRLHVRWPIGANETGRLTIDLRAGQPLIESLGIVAGTSGPTELLQGVEPLFFLTVGTRDAPPNRPPQMSVFNTFFDKPAKRPHESFLGQLKPRRVRIDSEGRRASVAVGDLTIGPFKGEVVFTLYCDSPLVHVEAVVHTEEERRAILYDTGLAGKSPGWQHVAWRDTDGQIQRSDPDPEITDRPLAVRHRTLVAECAGGAVACFPPPHQYQFPRDWTDNLKFVWLGRNHQHFTHPWGFGIRQVADGGRPFEPWFNAPPRTQQRLGVFYLVCRGRAEDALRETLRYTHGDRFPALPGHITFTSHWHMAVAVTAMNQKVQGIPEFVGMFKEMGVNAVHLADFHGDGHQKDPGTLRLPELEMLFRECERLSDDHFLLIPGEEVDEFLGVQQKGKHPGHWMSLFPRPVYWVMRRGPDQPFEDNHPRYGKVYRVGSRDDMVALLREEKGLAWSAHPRIKASSWTPDIFHKEDFYLADLWLGAAWKAMPGDLSRQRLGERSLDLLDDMANWGQKKYLPGEVDVFELEHTHELYGHMNVNYVRLPRLPHFEEGWSPLLAALRRGQFFVTTGEVLIRDFTVGGKQSGESLALEPAERP
ncbi:MAG TPA: hypothetical protein VKU02_16410, partial [Gemmataceae bacterium]|nr:hypothetical protein [Gemmataceae bacterium]